MGCLKVGLIVLAVLGVLGVLAVGCLAVVGKEVVDEIEDSTGVAADGDYELTGPDCVIDEFDTATATGTLKNTSDKKQAFQIEVRFEGSDGSLISEDSTFTDSIEVGQTTSYKVLSLTDVPPGVELSCSDAVVSYTIFDEGN